jgi:hypothetical protein
LPLGRCQLTHVGLQDVAQQILGIYKVVAGV